MVHAQASRRLIAFALLLIAPASLGAQQPAAREKSAATPAKRPLAIEDLYLFDGPQAVVPAPKSNFAVYVRQWIDRDSKTERFSLWRIDADGQQRRLERDEPDARSPVFSPDGRWIAIRSTRSRENGPAIPPTPPQSDAATDLWLVSADGDETIPLCGADKPYGRVFNDLFYGRAAFSPDGRRLVFVADDGRDPRTPEELAAGVEIVRPDQGEGYTGYGTAQIWVAHLAGDPQRQAADRIERLTDDDVWYGDPQWSADGRWLVAHANRTRDREAVRYSINKNYDLWAIDTKDGSLRQLTSGPGPEVSPRFSADGRRLACLSSPRKGPHADVFNLALVDFDPLASESRSPRTARIVFDFHARDDQPADDPAPTFPLPDDCWNGPEELIYTGVSGLRSATMRIDLKTGERRPLAASETSDEAAKLGEFERSAERRRKFTPPGNAFLDQRLLGESRKVEWTDDEGRRLEGVLTVPPAAVAQPPYKLVLFPHGGPHSRSSLGFNFTAQIFAAHGYAVFEPNFRGSAGYGRKFLDADRHDFGGGDMRDIQSGIESLIATKLVDRKRQFVYGVSYGGFMTCWLVGHTEQFRAAVAQNAVTDLNVMWGLSDIQSWTEWEFGGKPWEVAEAMRTHSPLTYADKVVTPTLILHSRDDRRCPIAMGRMFYQALIARGVPTEMVIYPDEGHGIRQPRHREDVLRRTLAWFVRHDLQE